jgi:hypothetical protein
MRFAGIALLLVCACSSDSDDDPFTSCFERETAEPTYNHIIAPGGSLAGTDCLGCHNDADPTAGTFDFAGTVFDTAGGPEAGVHIRLRDSNDRLFGVTTDDAGNFFLPRNTGAVFPVFPDLSACPTTIRMAGSLLDSTEGSCNRCHDGGVQARITLFE